MPQKKIPMFLSTRNVQTTPNVQFRQGKMGSDPGIYPNPLIGWRKQLDCSCNSWQQVFKNICCKPPIRRIQNRNGIIDASYSYTTQGYLERRCVTYAQNAFNFDISYNNTSNPPMHPVCCSDLCAPTHQPVTYKRSNPQFSHQGAVSSRARLNRLKYNTIVSSMPAKKIYWGGQPPNKNIMQNKSKNKCFCGPSRLAPCRGQNQPCGNTTSTNPWNTEQIAIQSPEPEPKAAPKPEPKPAPKPAPKPRI